MDTVGGGNHPFAVDTTQPHVSQYPYTSANGGHSHGVDAPEVTSTSAGAHSHAVNLPSATSTPATTGRVMPYVQLLFCRKE